MHPKHWMKVGQSLQALSALRTMCADQMIRPCADRCDIPLHGVVVESMRCIAMYQPACPRIINPKPRHPSSAWKPRSEVRRTLQRPPKKSNAVARCDVAGTKRTRSAVPCSFFASRAFHFEMRLKGKYGAYRAIETNLPYVAALGSPTGDLTSLGML